MFVTKCLYLFSERTQLSELYVLDVSAILAEACSTFLIFNQF
jgi:hypothetical protein